MRRSLTAPLLIGLLSLLLAAPADAAIRVRSTQTGAEITRFASLRCKVDRVKGFTASGRANGWRFTARIYSFSGFHRYESEYGSEGNADFFVSHGVDTTYSNVGKPETGTSVELTLGGAFAFPGGRSSFRVGYPLAYKAGDFSQQVSVVGKASCAYGRR